MKRSGILAITLVGIIMSMVLVFPNVSKEFSDKNTNQNILDTKVRSAVKMIESGEGNPMEAIFALREVVEVDSNHRDAQFYLGQFSIMSGQWNKAIDRFKKVLRINSSDEYAIESLAIARFQKGEKNGAVEDLKNYLELFPNSSRDSELRTLLESYQGEIQSEVKEVQ
ncbi:MAG: tetratricopeptide repeat protein [Schleiferiaceae bacterium]|jgi:tetratricopeptide (TPR) repeat protein|tara:strand:+ start:277 stop:780 length:504 start_codon:yes stop_codon:yes gene_type:complete